MYDINVYTVEHCYMIVACAYNWTATVQLAKKLFASGKYIAVTIRDSETFEILKDFGNID